MKRVEPMAVVAWLCMTVASARGVGATSLASAVPAVEDTVTVATGELYLYGNEVGAPYRLVGSERSLTINGVPDLPALVRVRLPQAQHVDSREHLERFMCALEENLLFHSSMDVAGRCDSVANYARAATGLVDSIKAGGASLTVWWRGQRHLVGYLIGASAAAGSTPEERVRWALGVWRQRLERDDLVLYSGARTTCATTASEKDELRAEIQKARATAGWEGNLVLSEDAKWLRAPLPLDQFSRERAR